MQPTQATPVPPPQQLYQRLASWPARVYRLRSWQVTRTGAATRQWHAPGYQSPSSSWKAATSTSGRGRGASSLPLARTPSPSLPEPSTMPLLAGIAAIFIEFELGDTTHLTTPFEGWDASDQADDRQAKLSRLQLGERFVYVFDLGDGWTHLCTVEHRTGGPARGARPNSRPAAPLLWLGRPSRSVPAPLGAR